MFCVRERGYTILPDFTNPLDNDRFLNVKVLFNIAKDVDLEGRAQMFFIQAFFQTHKRKETLAVTGRDERDWKTIFNHAIDALDEWARRKGRAIFSTTKRFAIVTMMKTWMGRSRFFSDLFLLLVVL